MANVYAVLLALSAAAVSMSFAAEPGSGSDGFAQAVAIDGGRRLYLECRGAGSPTVIFEAGLRNRSDIWSVKPDQGEAVMPTVASFTRVCAYDRPGTTLGADQFSRSDPAPSRAAPPTPWPTCMPCSRPRTSISLTSSSGTRPGD